MTLVYRSQRLGSINKQNELGPGSYNIEIKDKNKKQSSIFTSTTKRDTFNLQKIQRQQDQKLQKQRIKHKKNNILKQNENNLQQSNIIIQQHQHQHQKSKQHQKNQQQTHLSNQLPQILSGYNNLSYSTKKSSSILPCNNIFNSRVQRFTSQSIEMKYQIVSEQKLNQLLLAEQVKKLVVKDKYEKNNKNNQQNNLINKLMTCKPNLKQLQFKKRPLLKLQQTFPSIPTWENSYGYRKDPLTNKLISNQNPNKIFQIQQNNKQQQKNQCKGAGYYLYRDNNKNDNNIKKSSNINSKKYQSQQNKQRQLLNFMQYPKYHYQLIDYNTIQQKQNKIKHRIKLLGQNHITKINQYEQQNQINLLKLYEQNNSTHHKNKKDKKSILLQHQMLKQFGKYIPKNQQPVEYFQKLDEMKRSEIISVKQNHMNNNNMSRLSNHSYEKNNNFLSKSNRFNLQKYNELLKQNKNTTNTNPFQHCSPSSQSLNTQTYPQSILLQTFNKKQPYSLGEQRFHQKQSQNLGPGSYNPLQSLPYTKPTLTTPISLKLKQHRFGPSQHSDEYPGPGEYDITGEIGQKTNILSQLYMNYKQINKQQLRSKFNKEVSMEALYQTWGKQMSFRIKQDRIGQKLKLQTENQQQKQYNNNIITNINNNKNKHNKNLQYINEANYQSNDNSTHKIQLNIKVNNNNNHSYSITKTRKQLQKQMNKLKDNKIQQTHQKSLTKTITNSTIVHPKIIKHLYQYKQLDPNPPPIGPGSYEIRKQLDKGTFNVTYS